MLRGIEQEQRDGMVHELLDYSAQLDAREQSCPHTRGHG